MSRRWNLKTGLKKIQWLTMTITLCFIIGTFLTVGGCDKVKNFHANGTIIGYKKCYVDNNDLIGLYIVTGKKDFLLSFNISPSSINIDSNLIYDYGAYNLSGVDISFDYRIANEKEVIDMKCRQNADMPEFSGGPDEKYTQIIITDIKR